jgi:beta-galactosidase
MPRCVPLEKNHSMNRRTFLRAAGVVGTGIGLGIHDLFGAEGRAAAAHQLNQAGSDIGDIIIPDTGWRVWLDQRAEWEQDRIYLPAEVNLAKLPSNPPTGGWAALRSNAGREITLPATVEQFAWGVTGFRPYHDEYKFETTDDQVKNGAYYGVSWWWRELEISSALIGKRLLLHVRGARQRAEVYLNEKLVGYSIMEELPFECDLTATARAGQNLLAIRITNPGGRLDWVDGSRLNWAGLEFQKSHGFGGLDRGLTLSVHGPVRIADAWVLNTPAPRTITVHAEIENVSTAARPGKVRFAVLDSATGQILASTDVPLTATAGATVVTSAQLTADAAELWDLATPHLYRLRTTWISDHADDASAQRETEFGFRWFAAEGIGRDALFRLNGRRIRLYTSISWGYWAINGLFPTPELGEKEVRAAKAMNLNCLNFHRNLPKEDMLKIHDREGVLRCLEPGGGSQAVTGRDRPAGFAEHYMQAKIVGMIRAFRSHPSVAHYIIQNEGRVDPSNPALLQLFATMRAADPSRSIVGSDGFVMRGPEAWQEAYQDVVHHSDQPATLEGGAGGWWVDHSGHATDVWQDACYFSPRDYYYLSPNRAEIVEWGEMKGPASSDDHVAVLEEIRRHGGTSYDRLDHEEILAAYDAFLDRWGFRAAFPSASVLFRSIGRRAYESWGQLMENVRISDETDMAAISGWESTAMENHSGLVDNFRNFKSDPGAIAESLALVRPVAKQRALTLGTGERAVFDIYLLNDSDRPVDGELVFTLTAPDGRVALREKFPAPAFERDRLSYLVCEAVTSEPLLIPGTWRSRLALSNGAGLTHERELLVVEVPPAGAKTLNVALSNVSDAIANQLKSVPGVVTAPFDPEKHWDVVVFCGGPDAPQKNAMADADGADVTRVVAVQSGLPAAVMAAVRAGLPLLAMPSNEGHAANMARQLSEAGAFRFDGMVGTSRASWMGAWYFVRAHPLYKGMPVNQALGLHYQVKSGGANGWRIAGDGVEIVAGYGRDHDRHLGAGTFTAKLGTTRLILHQIQGMHPALHRRFLRNALQCLVG